MNKLLIIAQPRTGSSWLSAMLGNYEENRVLIEPIAPMAMDYFMKPDKSSNVIKESVIQSNLTEAIEDLFASKEPDEKYGVIYPRAAKCLVGFKIMIHAIKALPDPEILFNYVIAHNVKILINYRRDLSAMYVSEEIARCTGQPYLYVGMERKIARITIDMNHMLDRVRHIVAEREHLDRYLAKYKNLDTMKIYYEDYCDDLKNLNNVCVWAAGKIFPLIGSHIKQRQEPLRDVIVNYDDFVVMARHIQSCYQV
jgi:hypothetical protein